MTEICADFCLNDLQFIIAPRRNADRKQILKESPMDLVNRLKHYMDSAQVTISQFADRCGIPRPTMSQLMNGRNKRISDEVIGKIHNAFPDLSILWLMFGEGEMVPTRNIAISEPHNALKENTSDTQHSDTLKDSSRRTLEQAFTDSEATGDSLENLLFETTKSLDSAKEHPFEEETTVKENILFETTEPNIQGRTAAPAFTQIPRQTYQPQSSLPHPDDVTRTLCCTAQPASTTQCQASSPQQEDTPRENKRISISPDAHKKITNIVVFYSDNSFQSFLPDA